MTFPEAVILMPERSAYSIVHKVTESLSFTIDPKPRCPVNGEVQAVLPSFSLMQKRTSLAESPQMKPSFKTGESYP